MSTAYKKMTSQVNQYPGGNEERTWHEQKNPMIVEEHQGEIRIKPYTLRCNFAERQRMCMSFMGRVSVKPVQQKHLRS